MKIGVIEDGKLAGKKIVLSPRDDLPENLYLVESGIFFNGAPCFSLYCLVCDKEVPGKCLECSEES